MAALLTLWKQELPFVPLSAVHVLEQEMCQANKGLSIRHSTRNFPNREGSKVTNGQIASIALMDAVPSLQPQPTKELPYFRYGY